MGCLLASRKASSCSPVWVRRQVAEMARVSTTIVSRSLLTIVFFFTGLLFVSHPIHRRVQTPRDFFARPQPGDNNVFFLEDSCARNRSNSSQDADTRLHLDMKQACALESAARTNPEMNVFLFSSCPLDENSLVESSRAVQEIFGTHRNVFVWHENLESLFEDTGIEDSLRSGKIFDELSREVVSVVLLKKFGGTYLDRDFIFRRPLSQLSDNFACVGACSRVNGAALRLGADDVGRKVADAFVQEIKEAFDGKIEGHGDQHLTTRVVKKLCKLEKVKSRSTSECGGFAVYDHPVFNPIHRSRRKTFFADKTWLATVLEKTANSSGVHLWNSKDRTEKTHKISEQFRASNQPKVAFQRMLCPIAHSYSKIT